MAHNAPFESADDEQIAGGEAARRIGIGLTYLRALTKAGLLTPVRVKLSGTRFIHIYRASDVERVRRERAELRAARTNVLG